MKQIAVVVKNTLTETTSGIMLFNNERHASRVVTNGLIANKEPMDERDIYKIGYYDKETMEFLPEKPPKLLVKDDKPLTIEDLTTESKEIKRD